MFTVSGVVLQPHKKMPDKFPPCVISNNGEIVVRTSVAAANSTIGCLERHLSMPGRECNCALVKYIEMYGGE